MLGGAGRVRAQGPVVLEVSAQLKAATDFIPRRSQFRCPVSDWTELAASRQRAGIEDGRTARLDRRPSSARKSCLLRSAKERDLGLFPAGPRRPLPQIQSALISPVVDSIKGSGRQCPAMLASVAAISTIRWHAELRDAGSAWLWGGTPLCRSLRTQSPLLTRAPQRQQTCASSVSQQGVAES